MIPNDLGLDGSGASDNTDTLARLCSSRSTVRLPAGLYRVRNNWTIPAGCHLTGQPGNRTVIAAEPNPDGQSLGVVLSPNVSIDSVAFRWLTPALTSGNQHVLMFGQHAHGIRLSNVRLDGPLVEPATAPLSNNGLMLMDCNDVMVDGLYSCNHYIYGVELHRGKNHTYTRTTCRENGHDGFKTVNPTDGLTISGALLENNGLCLRDAKRGNGQGIDLTAGRDVVLDQIRALGNYGSGIQIKTTGTGDDSGGVGDVVVSDCVSNGNHGTHGFAVVHAIGGSGAHVENPLVRPQVSRCTFHGCIANYNGGAGFHMGAGTPGGANMVLMIGVHASANVSAGILLMPGTSNCYVSGAMLSGNGSGKQFNVNLAGRGHRFNGLFCDGRDTLEIDGPAKARYNIYAHELSDCVINGGVLANAIDRDIRFVGTTDTGDGLPDADICQLLGLTWDTKALYT